jgi:hypothetical protein
MNMHCQIANSYQVLRNYDAAGWGALEATFKVRLILSRTSNVGW